MRIRFSLTVSLPVFLIAGAALAVDAPKPKFGPDATPITQDHAYLTSAAAPDYWAISPFYIHQQTSSACSLASVTIAVNTLRGLPPSATEMLATQDTVLDATGDQRWAEQTAQDGDGVSFTDLVEDTTQSLAAFDIAADISAHQPAKTAGATIEAFRSALLQNEKSANDIMLLYFNQGVVTGDWDGPHISPVGAYDAAHDRVLIMDVDREWYTPYWTKTETLYKALLRPAPEDQGALKGETGGWLYLQKT